MISQDFCVNVSLFFHFVIKFHTCPQQVVASYFPLSKCLEGLKMLVESLFGATFQMIPTTPGESWHPDVIKLSLHHPEEVQTNFICKHH